MKCRPVVEILSSSFEEDKFIQKHYPNSIRVHNVDEYSFYVQAELEDVERLIEEWKRIKYKK